MTSIITAQAKASHPIRIQPRLDGVEALRAVAALMIVIYHVVLLPDLRIPEYLDIVKTHFGKGVPLFYALSGFVLAYGYLDKLNDRNHIVRFYVRRYFRIAPLFYLMIAVWMFVSNLAWGSFPASFHDLVLNVSLLFGLVPGKHESIVWAGWSIGVEILFYLLFPIVAAIVSSLRAGILALTLSIFVCSTYFTIAGQLDVGSYAYMNIVTHFPTFLAGVMAFLIWRRTGFAENRQWGAALFAATAIGMMAVVYLPSAYHVLMKAQGVRLDLYVWSILFMSLILSMCFWPNAMLINRVMTGLGRNSFSLYLWHPLIIVALIDVYSWISAELGAGLLNFMACAVFTISIVSFIAQFSFRYIEAPGMKFGKKVANAYH